MPRRFSPAAISAIHHAKKVRIASGAQIAQAADPKLAKRYSRRSGVPKEAKRAITKATGNRKGNYVGSSGLEL